MLRAQSYKLTVNQFHFINKAQTCSKQNNIKKTYHANVTFGCNVKLVALNNFKIEPA